MFCLFFCYFMSQWLKNEIFSFSRTLAFLFGQSCLYVTFTSSSTPSFGMLLLKLSNKNTCVYIQYENDQFFFTLQCELFTSCNVSNNANLVSARTGGGGGQPKVDRLGQGQKGPKNSQICADILYG